MVGVQHPEDVRAVNITLVHDFGALESHRGAWNALVERSPTSTIFQTWEMHASWLSACGAGVEPCVLIAEAGGKLVGIAPLVAGSRRKQRLVQFIGARMFDYADFIFDSGDPDVLPGLLGAVAERIPFDQMYLRDIPGTSPTIAALDAWCKARGVYRDSRVLYPAPTRIFNNPAADRELPNKKSLKRHYNYFHKAGRLKFRNCHGPAEIGPYLDVFFEQHVERRAATDAPSLFLDPGMREFFRALVRSLPLEWLLFSVVLFNDEPIAMHFGFEYGGRITWYKPAFDTKYAKHSPGEVLIKYLLEYALERNVQELDFTIGDEPFKYRFANHTRHNHAARIYKRWAPYRLSRLLLDARAAVERRPALARAARRLLWRYRHHPWL